MDRVNPLVEPCRVPRRRTAGVVSALLGLLVFLAAGAQVSLGDALGSLSPAEALMAFETEPGFAVELVAAEPLVVDPVAVAFDECSPAPASRWTARSASRPNSSPK